ncbi:hypothetical protein EFA46_014215 (plasmid) [Halarchaeum sp. CBA1220]|uniref:hypothetical protein n=1 Tax=Halarchaeum sp. CBA1220 TaxID=1853682 RepID=UPI0011CD634C|nr:hypothetical protein [Halarchaeum sp. CBA1220]QLC35402.1 hypothetical protein EFA46_014215 [Halarchaeum sp. CBA1220]
MKDTQTSNEQPDSPPSSAGAEHSFTQVAHQALRDARYIERQLDGPADQIIIAADDLDYAWTVTIAFLAQHEVREQAGSSIVTTERDADTIERDFEQFLPDLRFGILDLDAGQQSRPYRDPPVHTLSNTGDFTSLFLTLDQIDSGFNGNSSLLVHSLDALVAETSVETVTRLLKLFEWKHSATPQIFTLDLERCSDRSLENIRSVVDTLIRIEGAPDGTWITVE